MSKWKSNSIPSVIAPLSVLVLWTSTLTGNGAVVLLRNGGRIEGELFASPRASDRPDSYVVRLNKGGRIKIDARQVRKIIESSPAEKQYESKLSKLADTREAHWDIAQWCQENGLRKERRFHLEQVIRHDPDHEQARQILGFGKFDGHWVKSDELMRQRGYVSYKGSWKLPQQIAVMERQRRIELAEKQWRRQLRTWRTWLNGRRSAEAMENIRSIKDPLAVRGLSELVIGEKDRDIRELYVQVLSRIGNSSAVSSLVHLAIHDGDLEIRIQCIDRLKEVGRAEAVQSFTSALSSKDNVIINRAGVALGRLGDAAAIPALIDALLSKHTKVVSQPGTIRPAFSSSPDGSSGFNGLNVGGPKRVVTVARNKGVLEALVALTGKNFRYSQVDWKRWHIDQHATGHVNLRRMP